MKIKKNRCGKRRGRGRWRWIWRWLCSFLAIVKKRTAKRAQVIAFSLTLASLSSPFPRSILTRISLPSFQTSTKIEALREELNVMKKEDPSAKAIVFSQFTSMLELIQFRLTQTGACVGRVGSGLGEG